MEQPQDQPEQNRPKLPHGIMVPVEPGRAMPDGGEPSAPDTTGEPLTQKQPHQQQQAQAAPAKEKSGDKAKQDPDPEQPPRGQEGPERKQG